MTQKSLSVILLLGMLVGCTGTNLIAEPPSIGDGGLISDQPCASPCFFGVRIGETQLADVAPILEKSSIFPCDYLNTSVIVCGEGVFTITVGADPATSIVDGITFYPSTAVAIGDVIKKYGNPNSTWVQSEGTPEHPYMSAFLLWDSMKMKIDLPDDSSNIAEQAYKIENETKIWSVSFMSNSDFSGLFNNSYAKPWNGYGDYVP